MATDCIYPNFSVTLHAVRERFTTIIRQYKAKIRKEVQGTGLGGQKLTEYETLLEDLIERYEEKQLKSEQGVADKKSIETDKETILDIRKTAIKQYGETKKHREMEGDDQPKEKNSRRTSSDVLTFLQQKLELKIETGKIKTRTRTKREAR